jgi:hypothetical protein
MTLICQLTLIFSFVLFASPSSSRAAGCEDTIARRMVREALLAYRLVISRASAMNWRANLSE